MTSLDFLVIGKNQDIVETLKRLIENNEAWHAHICSDEQEAYSLVNLQQPDAILLSSGLSATFEADLQQFISDNKLRTRVIVHYGGGSGLLKSEIFLAFPDLVS